MSSVGSGVAIGTIHSIYPFNLLDKLTCYLQKFINSYKLNVLQLRDCQLSEQGTLSESSISSGPTIYIKTLELHIGMLPDERAT